MKLLLIGAASAAVLAVAGPAAAQFPPPPPPPADANQYQPEPAPDDQMGPGDQDQAGPDDRYDDQSAQPPPGYGAGANYGAGPDYEPADGLVQREDRLEQRIQRMARKGRLDPRTADQALDELRAIQDEQDQMARANRGLSPADQARLNARLDDLKQRLRSSRIR